MSSNTAQAIADRFAGVPQELKDRAQWVVWKSILKKGADKPSKVPYDARTGEPASTTDPATWATYAEALQAYTKYPDRYAGIGFVFSIDDDYCGVDLDDSLDEASELLPWARDVFLPIASYGEISPSGRGVKIIGKAKLPSPGRGFNKHEYGPDKSGGIEIYDHGRFFTITGRRHPACPAEILERPAITSLYERLRAKPAKAAPKPPTAKPTAAVRGSGDLLKRCLAYMAKLPDAISGQGGHNATLRAACECVRFGLDDAQAMQALEWFNNHKTAGEPWTERELAHKLDSARREAAGETGQRLQEDRPSYRGNGKHTPPGAPPEPPPDEPGQDDEAGLTPLGQRDPDTGRLVFHPRKTVPTTEALIREHYHHPEGRTVHSYADKLYHWQDNHYAEIEDGALRQILQSWLHKALRYVPTKDGAKLVGFESNPSTVNAVVESTRSYCHLPASLTPPVWLSGGKNRPDPRELLPYRSATLHVPTGKIIPPTPSLFNLNALDFDHDPKAPTPEAWLNFLYQLWKDDPEQIETLRQWFGYLLTVDTSLQKILMLVGPKRSGKGTIARVATRLVGAANVIGPTTSALAGPFGLQPLIGKSLAIVSDARFSGDSIPIVVERLLAISGEDTLTIDRKFSTSVTMRLATRFMLLTNELPKLADASGALAGRFIILRLTESFYGREDTTLESRLLAELPSILNWALDGWMSLRERGRFTQPASVADAIGELEDLASPVGAFIRDYCEIGPGRQIPASELFNAWQTWCRTQGRDHAGTRQVFSRDLHAAVAGIRTAQARDDIGVRYRAFDGITLNQSTKEAILADKMSENGRRGYVP